MKKHPTSLLRQASLLLLFALSFTCAIAQPTTINTTVASTGYNGTNNDGSSSYITFVITNNSGNDIELTDAGRWSDAAYNGTNNVLWYSSTSLSGAVTLAGPTWTTIATATPSGLGATIQVNPIFTGIGFTIPQGATYRFAMYTTATNWYSGTGAGTASPNTFTSSGVTLATGDFQIAGQYVGYGGANNPRFFTGSVTFKPKAIPCSGTPSNAIVLGVDEICPNKNFSLNVGLSSGLLLTGLTYNWQVAADGVSWTNWTGPVNANGAITDAIAATKWYRCLVTCISSGQSFTTPAKRVTIAPFYYCYCDGSKATTAVGMDIGNVTTISIPGNDVLLNNGNATPFLSNTNSNKSYSDFRYTVPPVPMYHDSTYKLLISQINSNAAFTAGTAAVYIDFNRNGRFDTYERVLLGTTTQIPPTPGVLTDTFTVPDTSGYGLTGMRVILKTGTADPDTCLSYTDGETEDYLVDLRYLPCNTVTTAGIVEGDTSMCTGYDYVLTDTTYQVHRYGLSKLWQVSADTKSWYDIPGTANQDTLMRVFTGQPMFYRLRMVCDVTHDTLHSDPHKINLKAAYKCYCFSQSNGTIVDSSDIGGVHVATFDHNDGGAHLGNPRAVHKRQDFTDMAPFELDVDSVYQIHIFHTMPRDQHADAKITVFMDFNNDHKYNIPEERVYTGFTNSGYHTVISNIIIRDSAITNTPTGMRIVLNNDVSPNAPSDEGCGTYASGETEDYMVMFKRPFLSGVTDLKAGLEHVQVYPNPGNGIFNIRFYSSTSVGNMHVKVTNMAGQVVTENSYNLKGGWFNTQLDVSGKAPGVYFVEINANGIKANRKLVIQ